MGRKFIALCFGLATTGCCLTCSRTLPPAEGEPPEKIAFYGYEVLHIYPHDPEAFTQGLVYENSFLYEGTGMYGASSIRKVVLETGEIVRKSILPQAYFGEGIAVRNGRLIQLTWKSQTGFVYDLDTFEKIEDFGYLGEGWGLAYDGKKFIMSDGTARLRFLDPDSFRQTGQLHVRYGDKPVKKLNELEYVDGRLYANIWQDNRIAIIDLESGYVTGWLDLSGLLEGKEARNADVLNGIAWDPAAKRLFVTGKYWPKLFEIRLVEKDTASYPITRTTP